MQNFKIKFYKKLFDAKPWNEILLKFVFGAKP